MIANEKSHITLVALVALTGGVGPVALRCFVNAFRSPARSSLGSSPYRALPLTQGLDVHCPSAAEYFKSPLSWRLFSQKDGYDNDDGDLGGAGMAEAFRQLDALSDFSLDDDDGAATEREGEALAPSASRKNVIDGKASPPSAGAELTPEQEVKLYQNMVRDLEDKSEEDLYSDVMSDILGGDNSATFPKPLAPNSASAVSSSSPSSSFAAAASNEALFNQALQEALQDVKLHNPSITDSVLDDKVLMQEIEEIFERGSEELLASLEDLRQEQRELARASADEAATEAVNILQGEARRLEHAEASMQTMLDRVGRESQQVEQAVKDLRAAQAQLDGDFLYQVKSGGMVKQLSLVGLVLFSLRSIADTVTALNDPSLGIASALVQGGIALVCALIFFVIK